MSRRTPAWLAWLLCALSLALTSVSLLLLVLNLSHPNTPIYDFWLEITVLPVSFSIIGAVLAARLPANALGWLFCVAACIAAVAHVSAEYVIYALLAQPNALPVGEALAWFSSWVWVLFIGCIALSFLLFPVGKLPDGRWAWLARFSALLRSAGAVWQAFSPQSAEKVVFDPFRPLITSESTFGASLRLPFGPILRSSAKFASSAQKATRMHHPSPNIGKQLLRVVLRNAGIHCMVRS
jgi:hypothetical protein